MTAQRPAPRRWRRPMGRSVPVVEAVDPEVPDVWLPGVAPASVEAVVAAPGVVEAVAPPVPVLAVPVLAVPVLAVPVLAVPVLAGPVLAGPVLAVELFVEVIPRRCAGTRKCTGGGAFGVGGVVTLGAYVLVSRRTMKRANAAITSTVVTTAAVFRSQAESHGRWTKVPPRVTGAPRPSTFTLKGTRLASPVKARLYSTSARTVSSAPAGRCK